MKKKGLIAFPVLFGLISLVILITAVMFFLFFKVNITSLFVDVENVNRYQEIPTTFLSSSFYSNVDNNNFENINCFKGNGPIIEDTINYNLCKKPIQFFVTKKFNGKGDFIDTEETPKEIYNYKDLSNDLLLSLPKNCYQFSILDVVIPIEIYSDTSNCDLENPKLNEKYPLPIFSTSGPEIIPFELKIGTTSSSGQELLITWPRYIPPKVNFVGN